MGLITFSFHHSQLPTQFISEGRSPSNESNPNARIGQKKWNLLARAWRYAWTKARAKIPPPITIRFARIFAACTHTIHQIERTEVERQPDFEIPAERAGTNHLLPLMGCEGLRRTCQSCNLSMRARLLRLLPLVSNLQAYQEREDERDVSWRPKNPRIRWKLPESKDFDRRRMSKRNLSVQEKHCNRSSRKQRTML